jgi:hypothetical protein
MCCQTVTQIIPRSHRRMQEVSRLIRLSMLCSYLLCGTWESSPSCTVKLLAHSSTIETCFPLRYYWPEYARQTLPFDIFTGQLIDMKLILCNPTLYKVQLCRGDLIVSECLVRFKYLFFRCSHAPQTTSSHRHVEVNPEAPPYRRACLQRPMTGRKFLCLHFSAAGLFDSGWIHILQYTLWPRWPFRTSW